MTSTGPELATPPPSHLKPICVAFVVHVMQVAGAEVLVRETIHRLGGAIRPVIFCLDKIGSIGEELQAEGVEVICLNRKLGRDWGVSLRMAKEIRRLNVEVIHAHQYTPFFYSALAKSLLLPRPKLILTEHGRHYPDLVSPVRRAFNRLILDRLADAVNACIGFSAKALSRIDGFRGNRIRVIENGIELEKYQPTSQPHIIRRELGLTADRRIIIHVARHHPVKDQYTLIRGFAEVAAKVADVDLLLVGDGPLRNELEDLATQLQVRDRVHFLGIRKDVPRVMQAGTIFALTSVTEAASLTLMEAMATGLPSVVSAVGGNVEVIREGIDGYHFPRGDSHALANAFLKLLTEPESLRSMGKNARQRVVERYQLQQTIQSYYQLYRELAGRPLH